MNRLKDILSDVFRAIGFRIVLTVGLILLASYVCFLYLILDVQEKFYFEQTVRAAGRVAETVINATNDSMLRDDRKATRSIIRDIGAQEGISEIRVYDHDGIIRFSNNAADVGNRVDKKAEACIACHAEDEPFSAAHPGKRTRIFSHVDHRVLGMISPIYNKKSCYTAPCHAHSEDRKVLGVLDMGISLKGVDAHTRSLALRIIGIGGATFIAVLGAVALYIMFQVHRPVSRLRDAAMKIAMGDFSRTLDGKRGDEIGECAWAFNIMRDQIRRRTQELSRSREEYKRLFEQVPCYICVINRDLEIVRQNSSMRELFKGGVGMRCHQVFKKRSTKCEDCNLDITFNEGRPTGQEHCGLKGSGEEANYISYATPVVNDNGEVVSAMIIAMDIGDRVRLQKALDVSVDFQANLIENSIHGIVATDQEGRVNIFNLAAETLFGYSADEAAGDTDLNKYFPRPFVEMILGAQIGRSPESPRLVAQEASITSKSGEVIPVRFSGFLLFENEKISGSVGFFQDLRMFKRLEREKAQSDRLAVVGQTVAGLAHGIKNILTGLEGGVFVVETAMEDHDEQLLGRGWKMVHNNIDRVSALVRDLLSYSKERAPNYEETDPNMLAEEVCALFEVRAQEKGIVIERDFDPTAGKTFKVFMDQRGIHTCLSNLVANAIDACESDAKKVKHRIVVQTGQDDDGYLIFRVSDDGAGIAEDTKRKIFSSFYSTKGSRGTGLGLLVTSKILAEHGGYISFESEEGQGATFTISLPPGRPKGVEDAEKSEKPEPDRTQEEIHAQTASVANKDFTP